jgi:hypothetical protein
MRNIDIGIGLMALVVAAAYGSEARSLEIFQRSGIPGPGFLPGLLAIAMGVIGALLIGSRLFGPAERFGTSRALSFDMVSRSSIVWLAFAAAILLLPMIGFVVASAGLVAVLLLVVERLRSPAAFATIVMLPVILHIVFVTLLSVRLPAGPWGF